MNWDCEENPEGFQTFPMDFSKCAKLSNEDSYNRDVTLKASIGICMDLSPYKFMAPLITLNSLLFALTIMLN